MGARYRMWLAGISGSIVVLCVAHASWATVRHVGKSGFPYRSIQSGINAAEAGDTVLVHQGTYYERINFNGKQITVSSVNGPRVTLINGGRRGSVVTFNSLESARSVLKGFTITNGSADFGGGISCSGSSPNIVNCTISGNSVGQYGGGIYCAGSSPKIRNCRITGNQAGHGGGICCAYSSSPTVANCTIYGNTGWGTGGGICYLSSSAGSIANCTVSGNLAPYGQGGGIFCDSASPSITACTISGNQASELGGGICCLYSPSPSVVNCTVSGNSAGQHGGGIHCYNSSPRIRNCTLSGNSTSMYDGGAIYCDGSSPSIVNCAITGNQAYNGGGIQCVNTSSPVILNCTLSGNAAWNYGGAICSMSSSSPAVVNGILWGNYGVIGKEIRLQGGSITVASSDVEGGWAGTGNIDADPLFIDARQASEAPTAAGDYRLTSGSPCIDEGYFGDGAPRYDIHWDPRPQNTGIDMGSDEYALLANGSFELGVGRIPVGWVGRNLSLGDRRDSVSRGGGHASFLMNGSATVKQLWQTLSLSGLAGEDFNVYCWNKAEQASSRGGFFGLALTVYHTDGTTKTYSLAFPKDTHRWIQNAATFRALKDYSGVNVSLVYARQTGKAWFDDVQFSVWR